MIMTRTTRICSSCTISMRIALGLAGPFASSTLGDTKRVEGKGYGKDAAAAAHV